MDHIDAMQTLALTRRFRLDGITQAIILYIWQDDADGTYSVTASHAIHTPTQASADVPAPSRYAQSPSEAADSVIRLYVGEYLQAIEASYQPSSEWLVRSREGV